MLIVMYHPGRTAVGGGPVLLGVLNAPLNHFQAAKAAVAQLLREYPDTLLTPQQVVDRLPGFGLQVMAWAAVPVEDGCRAPTGT